MIPPSQDFYEETHPVGKCFGAKHCVEIDVGGINRKTV